MSVDSIVQSQYIEGTKPLNTWVSHRLNILVSDLQNTKIYRYFWLALLDITILCNDTVQCNEMKGNLIAILHQIQ